MKKAFSISLLLFLLVSSLFVRILSAQANTTFAQSVTSEFVVATESAIANDSLITIPEIIIDRPVDTDQIFPIVDLPEPDFDEPENLDTSIIQTMLIQPYAHKDFRLNQAAILLISNAAKSRITKTQLFDPREKEIRPDIHLTESIDGVLLHIKPPYPFTPGRYTVRVSNDMNQTAETSFTWGSIILNTDKTGYSTGDTARLSFNVINAFGRIVCDASVKILIRDPAGKQTEYASRTETFKANEQCLQHTTSSYPDYGIEYVTTLPGEYEVRITAKDGENEVTIVDSFTVKEFHPFSIKRTLPSRIYPPDPFTVTLTIKATENFIGTIRDIVPRSFRITPASASASVAKIVGLEKLGNRNDAHFDIGSLLLPFAGQFPLSLGYGSEMKDPFWSDIYREFDLLGHDGLDFAMPIQTPVLATDAGRIVFAGAGDYGTTVIIEHAWGKSYYGHLAKSLVSVGQEVKKGDRLGLSGQSGLSSGPHLHFGIKPTLDDTQNGYYGKIDPLPYLRLPDEGNIQPAITSQGDHELNIISWDVKLRKGDIIDLTYTLKAPENNPSVELLGPLQIVTVTKNEESILISDNRLWQIISDQGQVLGASTTSSSTQTEPIANRLLEKFLRIISTSVNEHN